MNEYLLILTIYNNLIDTMLDEIKDDRLFRMIVEFESDYLKSQYERKYGKEGISTIDEIILEKDEEIKYLKSKLDENGIDY